MAGTKRAGGGDEPSHLKHIEFEIYLRRYIELSEVAKIARKTTAGVMSGRLFVVFCTCCVPTPSSSPLKSLSKSTGRGALAPSTVGTPRNERRSPSGIVRVSVPQRNRRTASSTAVATTNGSTGFLRKVATSPDGCP